MAFALSLLLSLTVPVVAHADTSNEAPGWPRHLVTDMTPGEMTTFGNDSMSLINCGNTSQAKSFQYIYKGMDASSLPSQVNGDGVSCSNNAALSSPDGTFYTTYQVSSQNRTIPTFAAMKNGRALWETDLTSDPMCTAASDWGENSNNAAMSFASIGSDGNIYGIVQASHPNCATYIAGINSANGHILFKHYLSNGSFALATRLWTYSDKILIVDTTGVLHKFDYAGNEDISQRYQFTTQAPGSGKAFGPLFANAQGRVYALTWCWGASTTTLQYHDLSGQVGTLDTGVSCNPQANFTIGADGNLIAVGYRGDITTIHIDTSVVTAQSMPLPVGSSSVFVWGYWQNPNGDAVAIRQLYGSNWTNVGMSIDEINGATGTIANLFLMGADSNNPSPSLKTADISLDSSLYALICRDSSQCPNTASTNIDGWIHKIPLIGFGAPIKDSGSFVTQVVSKRSLVAMGDSYSGGEGNAPFEPSTDTSSDQCHRSIVAYPWSVANTALLNLKLTDFTACTGATVWLMENGQNGEPAQTTALNDDTGVVTLTIGGNDVHFIEYVEACTWTCGPNTTPYNNIMTEINASSFYDGLKELYGRILAAAPNANVYVADYPLLAPQGAGSCAGFDLSGTYNVETALNDKIAAAVGEVKATNARLHFVEVNYSGSPFEGHDLCSGDASYFNGIVLPPNQIYSVHPKVAGQSAYAAVFSFAIE